MKTTLMLAITLTVVVLCTTMHAQSHRLVTIPRPTVERCRAALKMFNVRETEDIMVIGKYWSRARMLKDQIRGLKKKLEWQPIRIQQAEMAAKNIKRKPGESKEDRANAKKAAKEKIAAEKALLQEYLKELPGQIKELQVEYDINTKEYKAAVEQLLKALESKK